MRILKGGIFLSATGYIQVHAFTSNAAIPLRDVAITVTDAENRTLTMRLTDSSGRIVPIPISVPELAASQTPDTGQIPFAVVNLYARLENFEQIEAENIQVFAGTTTDQDLVLIPLSELPANWDQTQIFQTPPQNL